MKYNKINNIELPVSEIGFGAWAIGSQDYGKVEEADAFRSLKTFVKGGGNFIDTARVYNRSEERIGKFLKQEKIRDEIVIATKTVELKEIKIRNDIETSLKNLNTDRIDLYYLHWPPEEEDEIDRVLTVFQNLKKEGKIRAIGASIKGPDVNQKTVYLCRKYIKDNRIDALEVVYSILRQKNSEIFKEAQDAGIAIVARTILESGFLTGKYKPGHEFSDHRKRWSEERLYAILEEVENIEEITIKQPLTNITEVALRFVLDNPYITSIIPGAKNAEQVKKNMMGGSLPLLDDDIRNELIERYYDSSDRFNTDK